MVGEREAKTGARVGCNAAAGKKIKDFGFGQQTKLERMPGVRTLVSMQGGDAVAAVAETWASKCPRWLVYSGSRIRT
jgi:hypothetical protein